MSDNSGPLINCINKLLSDRSKNKLKLILTIIGSYYTSKQILFWIRSLWQLVRCSKDFQKEYSQGLYKTWAVITGGSDGIGRQCAIELARKGFNIALLVRNYKATKLLEQELHKIHKDVQVKIILTDFSHSSTNPYMFNDVYEQLKDYDIGILVNNVGVYLPWHMQMFKSDQEIMNIITVNCFPQVMITKKLAPVMEKRKKKSAIITLSSFAAQFPFGIYSATKVFNDYFSRSLNYLYANKFDVLAIRPRWVTTKLSGNVDSYYSIKAQTLWKWAFKALGHQEFTNGHWNHKFQSWLHEFFPYPLVMQYRYWSYKIPINAIPPIKEPDYKQEQVDQSMRKQLLNFSIRVSKLKETYTFFTEVLGMNLLRGEHYNQKEKYGYNGDSEGGWYRQIFGYSNELDQCSIEVIYNENQKLDIDYENSKLCIEILGSKLVKSVKEKCQNWKEFKDCEHKLEIYSPDKILFRIIETEDNVNPYIKTIYLPSHNIFYSQYFYNDILKMDIESKTEAKVSFVQQNTCKTTLTLVQLPNEELEKFKNAFYKYHISILCQEPKLFGNVVMNSGNGEVVIGSHLVDVPKNGSIEHLKIEDYDQNALYFIKESDLKNALHTVSTTENNENQKLG
eukprot:TRINITY_DN5549_c0_g1_i3.p1 TRINITY_DN5549_c0_g1~~TRINITY_DN5549_c0_g1_i3.p1  ORF type:complete len:621 (-),score=95.40 TRINITY_DN5549_c0_g1_i3:255-2117(-)